MNHKKIYIGILSVIFCATNITNALQISEIQFDPAGSDTGSEWIEIFNDANSSIDITLHEFNEDGKDHGISVLSGDKMLESGEYAVIVQDMTKFKTDFPSYTGKVFKASFSALTNSGEILILKNDNNAVLFTVDYSSVASSAGNGSTLNFNGTTWIKGTANPGTGSLSVNPNLNGGSSDTSNQQQTSTTTASTTSSTTLDADGNFVAPQYYHRSYFPESEKIYINAGENKIGISGADVLFEVSAVMGDTRKPVNANYFWSFGDGDSGEGAKVYHTYKYAGEYSVDIEVYANGSKSNSTIYVKVVDPVLAIKIKNINEDKVIEVANGSKDEVDIGGFLIKTVGGEFEKVSTLPKKLKIMPNKLINLSQETLKFATSTNSAYLLFPNGKEVARIEPPKSTESKKAVTVVVNNGSSTKFLSVMTKEDFDVMQNVASTSTKPIIKKIVYKSKIAPKSLVISEEKKPEIASNITESEDVFVVRNDASLIDSFWRFFSK